MIEWINARLDPPVKFCKYFVKIDGVKSVIDFHEIDRLLQRDHEVYYLREPENTFTPARPRPGAEYNFKKDYIKEPTTDTRPIQRTVIVKEAHTVKVTPDVVDYGKYMLIEEHQKIIETLKSIIAKGRLNKEVKPYQDNEDPILNTISTTAKVYESTEELKKALKEKKADLYIETNMKRVGLYFPEVTTADTISAAYRSILSDTYGTQGLSLILIKHTNAVRSRNYLRNHPEKRTKRKKRGNTNPQNNEENQPPK